MNAFTNLGTNPKNKDETRERQTAKACGVRGGRISRISVRDVEGGRNRASLIKASGGLDQAGSKGGEYLEEDSVVLHSVGSACGNERVPCGADLLEGESGSRSCQVIKNREKRGVKRKMPD